jgi:predicted lipoprotein with Yx(FWY)xxD motif
VVPAARWELSGMRESTSIILYGVLVAAGLLACTRNQDEMSAPPLPEKTAQAPVAPTATPGTPAPAASDAGHVGGSNPLVVATSGGKSYISDRSGAALYFAEGDSDGSKCTDRCTDAWPPLLVTDAAPSGGAGLAAGDIGTITRVDGSRQVSWRGHPLYRYAADIGADSTAGDGVQDKWGHWHIATPQGRVTRTSPPGTSPH